MRLIEQLIKGIIPQEVKTVSEKEKVSTEFLVKNILAGKIVIPKNSRREVKRVCGIGFGLKTKVNANIGSSPDMISVEGEKEKLFASLDAGTDAVMDLSTGGNLRQIRKMVLDNSPVPVGTVPIYQAACATAAAGKDLTKIDPGLMFDAIEEQVEEGVDFVTVHCGITKQTVASLDMQKRLVGIVSRGGSMTAKWIKANNKENPLYENYDRLLDILKKYDVTLSLGDGLRPGCINDASDAGQIAELSVLGELVLRARQAGVQVLIEGPGHMPMDHVASHVQLAKRLGNDAPLYLLGPLVTDVAAGYDHITGAIGGAIAAAAGADFLCYVTPAEHLHLPKPKDVYDGVIASRIAGHAADIVKYPAAREWDYKFSKYRKELDWEKQEELALDPINFAKERREISAKEAGTCSMCGAFCSMREK
jgi:phosphomethylpyrimidine synthase